MGTLAQRDLETAIETLLGTLAYQQDGGGGRSAKADAQNAALLLARTNRALRSQVATLQAPRQGADAAHTHRPQGIAERVLTGCAASSAPCPMAATADSLCPCLRAQASATLDRHYAAANR